ncbi:MAG: sigma-70 family RNA polymerase sigma factor [Actinomycetota bacterium]|nr:sigma-70 family RNA polymerase sigma factor [Actinomycetota bacterium]
MPDRREEVLTTGGPSVGGPSVGEHAAGLTVEQLGRAAGELTPDLLRFARRLTDTAHAADDLVQDTFARALQARSSFRGDAGLHTWLHRIMWNLAIDRTRRQGRELLVGEVEDRWRDDQYSVDPHAVIQRAGDADDLREALIRLPFIYRSAVVLHDSLGWPHHEIAERLGISVANAKQRVHRGRMLLTTALADGAERAHRKGAGMRCWDAREQVSDYLDGALAAPERAALEAHLQTCPTCPPLYAALVGSRSALSAQRDADDVLRPDLVARVRALVRATGTE